MPSVVFSVPIPLISDAAGGPDLTVDDELMSRTMTLTQLQLGEMTVESSQFLRIAAVLGRSFLLEDVVSLMEISATALLRPLDEALCSGLIVVSHDAVSFATEQIWQAVLRTIPPPLLRMLRQLIEATKGIDLTVPQPTENRPPLTADELRIAQLVAQGLTNHQIANRVLLSPHTVNYHLRQMFRKLGVSSRTELAAIVRTEFDPASWPSMRDPSGTSATSWATR